MRAKNSAILAKIVDQKIAVIGLGVSGFSALQLLVREKAKAHAVNSGPLDHWPNREKVMAMIGEKNCHQQEDPDTAHFLSTCDLIILNPGIPREHPLLQKAHLFNVPIWGEIELGLNYCYAPIIAITGTNGKTTTTSLIGEIFKRAGKKPFVGGNIGVPLCDYANQHEDYDVIILELSSFQLESVFQLKCDVALILNVAANHGERYSSIEDYAKAKWRITQNTTGRDFLLFDGSNSLLRQWAEKASCSTLAIESQRINEIKKILGKKFNLSNFKLVGEHNILNLFFAYQCMDLFNKRFFMFSNERLSMAIQESIDEFCGVPHRTQFVATTYSFLSFNDAKSTNWLATLTAVQSIKKQYTNKELWLIVGGKLRGRGEDLSEKDLQILKANVDRLLLFGESCDEVEKQVFDRLKIHRFHTLIDVMNFVLKQNKENSFDGCLLFSPAYPSFDQYRNYEERGAQFIKCLGGTPPPPVEKH